MTQLPLSCCIGTRTSPGAVARRLNFRGAMSDLPRIQLSRVFSQAPLVVSFSGWSLVTGGKQTTSLVEVVLVLMVVALGSVRVRSGSKSRGERLEIWGNVRAEVI